MSLDPERFSGKYRIATARLANWDYGSHGLYFITICTKNRFYYFGNIDNTKEERSVEAHDYAPPILMNKRETQNHASMHHSHIGGIAYTYWNDIPTHFPFIELDEYVIMPNHIHGILFINKPLEEGWQPNQFGPQKRNLASVLRAYKASVKRYATEHEIEFAWQPRYYDHIIRSEKELANIRQYIFDNPIKWTDDKDNPENLYM